MTAPVDDAAPLLAPQAPGIRLPRAAPRSAPFWEGCRRGELVLPRCPACGAWALRAFAVCPGCQATDIAWQVCSGRGSLYSWTVVWRPPHATFAVPYAPAVVALDEGAWLLSAVIGCTPDELRAGMRLEVAFHPASDDRTLPYVQPAAR